MFTINQQIAVAFLVSLQLNLHHCSGLDGALTSLKPANRGKGSDIIMEEQFSGGSEAGSLVVDILQSHMDSCHKTLAKEGNYSPLFDSMLRTLNAAYESQAIAELREASFDPNDIYFQKLKIGEEKSTCRAFVFDLSNTMTSSFAIKFMDNIQMFLIPDTFVIFVGKRSHLEEALMSSTLRNTINVLYLVVEETDFLDPYQNTSFLGKSVPQIVIYSRCLFCNSGHPGIELVDLWTPITGFFFRRQLFRDQFLDFQGYQMRVTQMGWFPLIGFTVDSTEDGSTVTPLDTLHVRMLKAIAGSLNFTYEMRLPWDCQWGVSTPSGNWTGIIGTLQHHKSDFGMSITYNLGRMKVVDYTRFLLKEPVLMVMSKPRPPPPYLAIIHPFTGHLWGAVIASCLSGGLLLWVLQLVWEKISGEQGLTLDISYIITIGGIFQEPTRRLPRNTSSLMCLSFWWIYCLLITVSYKSSLIAHLSVPGKSKAIDSLDEMLKDSGWTWGYNDNHSGIYDVFRKTDHPIIKQVYQGMQIQPNAQQVERILKEKHVLIIKEFLFKSLKSAIARTRGGDSPFYFGKQEIFANGDGWAFRQNAPFYDAIDMKLQQLIETGHLSHWLNQLIGTSPEDICDKPPCKKESEPTLVGTVVREESGQVVLSLNHLQSAFYLIPVGLAIASPVFIAENLYHILK